MIDEIVRAPKPARELFPYRKRQTYRDLHTKSREEQAQMLEKLRYRSYPLSSLRQRIMQRLGDVGRKYAAFARLLRF